MSNKSNGNHFEREMAKILSDRGYWVHRIQDNENGQPFDLIAVGSDGTIAIDCKLCQGDSFKFSRIEDNQRLAFEKFNKCVGEEGSVFALKFNKYNSIAFLPYEVVLMAEKENRKEITYNELMECEAIFYGNSVKQQC